MTDVARSWAGSYRVRLAVGYVLIVALFASAWAWSLSGPLTRAVIEQQQGNLQAVAQAGALVLGDSEAAPAETVARLTARTDLRMTIVAADGRVIADSEENAAAMENHGDRPEVAAALDGETGFDQRLSNTQGVEQVYVAVPASLGGETVALRVSESLERISELAASWRRFGLILLAVALLVAGVVVTRLTAVATEPVQRLSEAARTMAAGDLTTRVPRESGDLEILSSALDDLQSQMKRRLGEVESEQHTLRSVLDGLDDAVFLFEGESILFANRAASRLFRAPAAGWRGRGLEEAGLPEPVTAAIAHGIADGGAGASECGPDVSGTFLRIEVLPVDPSEQAARALVVITDITERTQVDRMRRDFVANASHELKTPTAAIQLLAESASHAAGDGDTEHALAFTRQIAEESLRLGRVVQDLLDLSRLETAPEKGSVTDLREAAENALLGHRVAAEQRGISLVFDAELVRGRDVIAAAGATDVAIALDNLLDNAITYTESGTVTVSLSADEREVRVSVADSGVGIPAEDLPRIFERFYRVDRARSRDSGGTGLGLSLVRHVVERSDGSIEVTSEPGTGSTFTITLPVARL